MPDSKLPEHVQRNINTGGGNNNEHIGRDYIQANTVNYYKQNICVATNNSDLNQLSDKQT